MDNPYLQYNYHTHTTWCDGKSTAREMAEEAVSLGMKVLGFSGHAHLWFDESYPMSIAGTRLYREEILSLREEFKDRIGLLLGIEQDYFSDPIRPEDWDYVIGGVHFIKVGRHYLDVDDTKETLEQIRDEYFDGDIYRLTALYYEQMGDLVEKTGCSVVAHFDLINKFNEDGSLFDTDDPRYVSAYEDAMDRLLSHGAVFEINAGGVLKGYRSEPYPSMTILKKLKEAGAKITFSCDAHHTSHLAKGLELAYDWAEKAGVLDQYVCMTCHDAGFVKMQ